MSIQERKERERDERRELILSASSEIISEEGIDNLSIRKIASRIEYSPAIIYHYFNDKDDIINNLMKKGYQKIVGALASVQTTGSTPLKRLKELTRSYIDAALKMPDEFKAVQLSDSPAVLEHTSSLFKGASVRKPALGILFQCLKDIYNDESITDSSLELTAQVIASATFGLIIRLIVEKDVDLEQRSKLIDHFINCIVDGMVLGKPLNKY